jgi:hypothetical protein
MKPKKNKGRRNKKGTRQKIELWVSRKRRNSAHGSSKLIASLQALLSIANSLEIFNTQEMVNIWNLQKVTKQETYDDRSPSCCQMCR